MHAATRYKNIFFANIKKNFSQLKANFSLFKIFLSRYSIKWWDSPEIIKTILTQKKRGTLRLLIAPVRHVKHKIESAYKN